MQHAIIGWPEDLNVIHEEDASISIEELELELFEEENVYTVFLCDETGDPSKADEHSAVLGMGPAGGKPVHTGRYSTADGRGEIGREELLEKIKESLLDGKPVGAVVLDRFYGKMYAYSVTSFAPN